MQISIVVGAGFGDEGKGNFVNHLSKQSDGSLVVRFNGGHQAGHTVVQDGTRHVFSSFGSGTLNGVNTYWSKYCTVYPTAFNTEYDALLGLGVTPTIIIDPLCPITTPFDVLANKVDEKFNGHGSVGVGHGRTMSRHESIDHSHRIFAIDLKYKWILRNKLKELAKFYQQPFSIIDKFLDECEQLVSRSIINNIDLKWWDHVIFEGAQGILLDREHGIFPHVTRSKTTSANAVQLIDEFELPTDNIHRYMITRFYSTRHGNGPFIDGTVSPNNSDETNVTNPYQGEFRVAPLDFDLLDYAYDVDSLVFKSFSPPKHWVVTCMDQINGDIPIITGGEPKIVDENTFKNMFPMDTFFVNRPDY